MEAGRNQKAARFQHSAKFAHGQHRLSDPLQKVLGPDDVESALWKRQFPNVARLNVRFCRPSAVARMRAWSMYLSRRWVPTVIVSGAALAISRAMLPETAAGI